MIFSNGTTYTSTYEQLNFLIGKLFVNVFFFTFTIVHNQ